MDSANALSINWSFGFSKDITAGVHSLSSQGGRNAMFYVSAHSGVIYDYENRTQLILQGHCNNISCCAVSRDKRWIVTADVGEDSILVVWDAISGAPVKTLFQPHRRGTVALDISDDALYVATLSAPCEEEQQELSVWAWTTDADSAMLTQNVCASDAHNSVKFNPSNQAELTSCGERSVCFWTWREFSLECYKGKLIKKDLGHFAGSFTGTIFLPGTSSCLTATSEGYVIVWGTQYAASMNRAEGGEPMKMAVKAIRLVECGINLITTVNQYVVVACSDGAVRMFDFSLRLEAWFEDLAAGSVTSVSFADAANPFAQAEAQDEDAAPRFWTPDFLVGTSDAFIVGVDSQLFHNLRAEQRRGILLVQGMSSSIECVCCHPTKPLIAVLCKSGVLQVWDYQLKLLMNLRECGMPNGPVPVGQMRPKAVDAQKAFARPMCMVFNPSGENLVLGYSNGIIAFVDASSLQELFELNMSETSIVDMKFSYSGEYFAAYDVAGYIMIYKKQAVVKPRVDSMADRRDDFDESAAAAAAEKNSYLYLGRIIPHKGALAGLQFGLRENREILVSVGVDRRCIEFDLHSSSVEAGIVLAGDPVVVELTAKPTALLWHPHLDHDVEDRFVYATDDYKFKNINADSKLCRKTTLAPTFGGPVAFVLPVPSPDASRIGRYFAYRTHERIVGLSCLPLTGDPNESIGIVAHPGEITSICLSFDGAFMFTAGGADLTVNMWALDLGLLEHPSARGEPLQPFLDLLEGGKGGDLHNDIIEYFYYCQLKSQPEDSMDSWKMTGRIAAEDVPSLLRAVGYYPSEEEANNIINEIRYRTYMYSGEIISDASLEEIIKLYVNHRPAASPLSAADVTVAFNEIRKKLKISFDDVDWATLERVLTSEGEVMSREELGEYLEALLAASSSSDLRGNIREAEMRTYDANAFSQLILGFENMGTEQ